MNDLSLLNPIERKVYECIPLGSAHPISQEQLANLVKTSRRSIAEIIQHLRHKGFLIGSSRAYPASSGYYKISNEDEYFMYIWNLCRYIVGIVTVIIILMSLYKFTPNKKLKFREVIPGSIVSTFCWLVVSFFYSFYSNNFSRYDIIYGSLGGIIVLMTWVYLSSWTILIGCEINARLYKRKIR